MEPKREKVGILEKKKESQLKKKRLLDLGEQILMFRSPIRCGQGWWGHCLSPNRWCINLHTAPPSLMLILGSFQICHEFGGLV